MKIALVHNLRFGGAHRRMSEQLRHLGLPVTEVTMEGAEPLTEDAAIVPLAYRGKGAQAWARPVTRHLDLLALVAGYRQLHARVRDLSPDVIWLNHCRYLQTPWLADDLARLAVYHCDEPRRVDYEASARSSTRLRTRVPYWPMRRLSRHLDRATAMSAAVLTTNSSYSVGQIRGAYGLDAVVVPCGVASHFRPPVGPADRDHLLSVGSLIPSKGHDLALQAAGRCGLDMPVVVVAPRDDAHKEARLHRIATEVGIRLTVKIGVSDQDLVGLYRSARVTLYLATAEPFGLASIEAQACGCPVIVSDEGGLPETLVPGATGWAVPRRVDDIAARLALFHDDRVSEELGGAAVRHATKWSWDVSATRLADVLTSVARR